MPNKQRLKRKVKADADVLFFHMPKTGGSALNIMFASEPRFWSVSHVQPHFEKKKRAPADWDRAWKVGMLRNPYDRMISAWYHFVSGRHYARVQSPVESHILGFENWIRLGVPKLRADYRSADKHYCQPHPLKVCEIQHFFKTEEMDTAIEEIAAHLGAKPPANIRSGGSRVRPKVDWRLYYHKGATRRSIENWCAWEFEVGGYEKL
jgi:hypothetical protein